MSLLLFFLRELGRKIHLLKLNLFLVSLITFFERVWLCINLSNLNIKNQKMNEFIIEEKTHWF